MPIKYEYMLCSKCRKNVRAANAAEQRRRVKAGKSLGGRPRLPLDARIFEAVLAGKLSVPQAAELLGVCTQTVTRRLKRDFSE